MSQDSTAIKIPLQLEFIEKVGVTRLVVLPTLPSGEEVATRKATVLEEMFVELREQILVKLDELEEGGKFNFVFVRPPVKTLSPITSGAMNLRVESQLYGIPSSFNVRWGRW